jgi:hypothetical protein
VYLYFFRPTFFGATVSSSRFDDSRFLFEVLFCTIFTVGLLRAAAEVARVEDARRRVEETSAVESFFFFLASFTAAAVAAAAAASTFLS